MPEFLDGQFKLPVDTRTESTPVTVALVAEDSPADRAGIKPDDYIIAVDGNQFMHASEIMDYNEAHAGEEVLYKIHRRGKPGCNCDTTAEYLVKLNEKGSDYLLGVSMITTQSLSYSREYFVASKLSIFA